jgi:hypothetical protein
MKKLSDLKTEANFSKPYPIARNEDMIAKKDFVIHQNEHHYEIKKGDDVSDIPKQFHANLKTEEVI